MFRSNRYQQVRERLRQKGGSEPRIAATSFVLLGLILGLAGGLVYAWIINPVVYVDASPARLNDQFTDEYLFLVSQSYALTGDWETAQRRLNALEERDVASRVAALFEEYLREGRASAYVRNLAVLTQRLGGQSPALSLFGPTPQPPPVTPTQVATDPAATATLLPTPTPTVSPTPTPRPTLTPSPSPIPTATSRPPFRLVSQERVCDDQAPAPRIEIETFDALLEPLPGVEIIVTWDDGSDRFFTGFQPDRGLGYADFAMEPDASYSVSLAAGSPTISGLRVEPCPQDEGGLPGGWRLTFQNLTVRQATATPET